MREWRHAGTHIPEKSDRREAFNITLSMPRGTEAIVVRAAAREMVQEQFNGHRVVMVLHEHQENPHVHVVVRAERDDGRRLNPRKADLHRWRERFAAALRSYGIEAAATRQVVRGAERRPERLWEIAARSDGRLRRERAPLSRRSVAPAKSESLQNWRQLEQALSKSSDPKDRELAGEVRRFILETPAFAREVQRLPVHQQFRDREQRDVEREERGYDRGREIVGPER